MQLFVYACVTECTHLVPLSVAIERAMAYMDTGELPWNMDLFDTKKEVGHHFVKGGDCLLVCGV